MGCKEIWETIKYLYLKSWLEYQISHVFHPFQHHQSLVPCLHEVYQATLGGFQSHVQPTHLLLRSKGFHCSLFPWMKTTKCCRIKMCALQSRIESLQTKRSCVIRRGITKTITKLATLILEIGIFILILILETPPLANNIQL